MSTLVLVIPDAVRQKQIVASDPDVSAFVAANAGSGKTHVLAQRVIRLLLNGVPPEKILCITFTKAAAANMTKRVFDTLAQWTALKDKALEKAMRETGAANTDRAARAQARRLFAQALETPGGLKVQTIHAFCTRLLHLFPFEANVAARFTVLDERAENELLDRASLAVLLDAAAEPTGPLGRALSAAIAAAADTTFRDVVRETIGNRDALQSWIDSAGSVEAAIREMSASLGIDPDDTLERAEAEIVEGPNLPSSQWARVASICKASSKNDQKQGGRLSAAAAATGSARVEAYLSVFFTAEFEPRKSLMATALADANPDLAAMLATEQLRLFPLLDRWRAVIIRDRSAALVTIAAQVIDRYRAEKDRRGLLDYDDLIDKTIAMLATVNPSWVHYKLDYGIDHVLIDEAQDTSEKQWRIIAGLVSEFAAGAGARPRVKRTLFAVGDEKQSIFSFQGAAPRNFDRMRREFEAAFDNPECGWRYERLQFSFRSGANVIGAVDEVFDDEEIYISVTSDSGGVPRHEALPGRAPGLVEIWELEKPAEKHEIEGWQAPFDELSETSPQVRLARRIASAVHHCIAQGTRAGDVLVLVRQRGLLFEAIIRALKEKHIAVAGADRLKLTEHIAIEDLMALADALLLPQDDLALAVALKSPLFGLDEDRLFALAFGRKVGLRDALLANAADEAFAAAAARLRRCENALPERTPFSFYAWLLGPEGGRAAMLARLGPEAADALDEFLALALDYERRETPSLQGFVAWLRAAETEIKRDMDIVRDEVRVMTVHGAKGLEAPIVILADTTTPPTGPYSPRLLKLPALGAAPGTPPRIVWAGAKTMDVPAVANARQDALVAAEDEYRRLLYVAMTRAADRLIVCGYEGEKPRREGCWYDLVRDALAGMLVPERADDGSGEVLRYRKQAEKEAGKVAASATAKPATTVALKDWLRRDLAPEPRETIAIRPSTAVAEEFESSAPSGTGASREEALARGSLVHRLLQSLPDLPAERRAQAAQRHLARAAAKFSEAQREQMLAQVLRIFEDPRFALLFAPGSRAEVPIVGRLARKNQRTIKIAGQVDRLVIGANEILIADYKTNRPAPRSLDQAMHQYRGYVTQLAYYRAVLGLIYPGRNIRAALVWTDIPDLMEIPGHMLDSALSPPHDMP